MTAQLVHAVTVKVHVSETGTRWWRGECRCNWKSSPYRLHETAAKHAAEHHKIVADGEWRGGGVVA